MDLQDNYLKKSTSKLFIRIMDVKVIPSSIILPVLFTTKKIKIKVEYEDISKQYNHCLEIEHKAMLYQKKLYHKSKNHNTNMTSKATI